MTAPNGSNGIWGRILIALIPLCILGVLALASMRSDVRHLQGALDTKANRETVEAQNREVLRSLEALRQDIQDLRRQLGRGP